MTTKFRIRLLAVLTAAVTAASCLMFPAGAEYDDAEDPEDSEGCSEIFDIYSIGDKGKIRYFTGLFDKDADKACRYYDREFGDSDIDGMFVYGDVLEPFSSRGSYGVAVKYIRGRSFFDDGGSLFNFTFFCSDGSFYSTPPYSAESTKALSVKKIMKDSGIPTGKKPALARVNYIPDGLDALSLELHRIKNGWIEVISDSNFDIVNDVFLAEDYYRYYNFAERGFYFRSDGSAATGETIIGGTKYVFDDYGAYVGVIADRPKRYDSVQGYKSKIKTFVSKYKQNEKKGIKYFRSKLVNDDSTHVFMSKDALRLFQTNANYAAAITYDEGMAFNSSSCPEYRQFGVTFFLADGRYYDTPMYDVTKTKAVSVKQMIKDSRIPDCKKIAAAEVWYYTSGMERVSLELHKIKDGWIEKISGESFSYPKGAFVAQKYANGTSFKTYGFYIKKDGTAATGTVTINGVRRLFADDGTYMGRYTGWYTTTSGKLRYYKDGCTLSGWQNMDGSRYYFKSDGSAAIGELCIADCTYTFGSGGAWTGDCSLEGLRPADFQAAISRYCFEYDSDTGSMRRTINYDYSISGDDKGVYAYGNYELDYRDKQILWSIIEDYELTEANTRKKYDYNYVVKNRKKYGLSSVEEVEPSTTHTFSFTAEGDNYRFRFTDDSYQLVGYDDTVTGIWTAYKYLESCVESSYAYKCLPPMDDSLYLE